MDKLSPANEPIGVSTIVTVITWAAAHWAFSLDTATATAIATVVLVVGQWIARRFSVPVKRAQSAVNAAAAAPAGTTPPKL